MPRPLLMTGLWMLGLIMALQLGRSTRPPPEADLEALRKIHTPAAAISSRSPAQALRMADARAFPQAVSKLRTSDEFRSSFEELLPSLQDGRTHDSLFMLADAWASKDPAAATSWLAALHLEDARNPYLFSAFSQWAALDPRAARAWLDANPVPTGSSRDYMLASLVRGLSVSDPEAALETLLAAPDSPERSGSIDFLIRAWSARSLDHAFAQVAALPESADGLKSEAIRKLTAGLTTDELESARAWAAGLSAKTDRDSARIGIAARWSQSDPSAAAAWAAEFSEVETRSMAYGEIAARWARIDPLAASAWLGNHTGQADADLAARSVAWSTVGIDPDLAFSQVAGITREALRDETFEQIGRFWLSREPQAAKAFLERDVLMPPAVRELLLESFE